MSEIGELIGLAHDLGKYSEEFQRYIKSATGLVGKSSDGYVDARGLKGTIDHSSAGAQYLYRKVAEMGKVNLFLQEIIALAVVSHHSGLIDCLSPDGQNCFSSRMEKPDKKTNLEEVDKKIDDLIRNKILEKLSDDSLADRLNKVIGSLHDINDSNDTFMFKVGLLTRMFFSGLIDADRIDSADFEFSENTRSRQNGKYTQWNQLIKKIDSHLARFVIENDIDAIRQEISRNCLEFSDKPKGLYQLTVPTGGGKTLSSLRFALNHANFHEMDRVIYFVPFTSIIDQNADVAREIFEGGERGDCSGKIVLEHHSNLTPEIENDDRQKILAENWDASIVFTTMVQFLEALFGSGTRSVRRMHQLSNAVIIFDEIQTLPVRCVYMFNVAIKFLIKACGATVILCTATQPLLDKINPIRYALQISQNQQMIANVSKLFDELKRYSVFDKRKNGGWIEQEVVELAKSELNRTNSVLIVVNTKVAAVNLFGLLKKHKEIKAFHLSTNMCPAHRMDVLGKIRECLANNEILITVSTQLIEAGVDVDFGTVIRYLAGLDSLAQAAGRCNRSGARDEFGHVYIINPADEKITRIKDIRIGIEKAERVLDEFRECPERFDNEPLGLRAMECYFHYYFYERSRDMDYPVSSNSDINIDGSLFELLSDNYHSVEAYKRVNNWFPPPIRLRQSFMSAAKAFESIDSNTQGVIVPYRKEGKRIIEELRAAESLGEQYKLLKEAQRYSVNIFPDKLVRYTKPGQQIVFEMNSIPGVFYLGGQYYSDEFGVSESIINEMETLIM